MGNLSKCVHKAFVFRLIEIFNAYGYLPGIINNVKGAGHVWYKLTACEVRQFQKEVALYSFKLYRCSGERIIGKVTLKENFELKRVLAKVDFFFASFYFVVGKQRKRKSNHRLPK